MLTKIVDVTVEVLDAAVLNPVIPVNDRCPDVLVNKVVPAYRDALLITPVNGSIVILFPSTFTPPFSVWLAVGNTYVIAPLITPVNVLHFNELFVKNIHWANRSHCIVRNVNDVADTQIASNAGHNKRLLFSQTFSGLEPVDHVDQGVTCSQCDIV